MKPNWKRLFLLTTCCTLGLMTSVRGQQVSPDGTLSTTVTSPDSLNFTINNGNRVGGNLFHSFREFSVPNGGSAVFQNPLDVQNIITRVTGGSLSQINGLIQSQGSANLFLLNPAGIFFGPNARLSIGGSFFATTADSLLFDNGFEFSATNPQAPPLLTVNIPVGLRFRDNPGNITNQAALSPQVPPGQTFALIGGDVNFDGGSLTALGVNVEIGGLKAPGTVGINNDRSLSFPDGVTRGDISFRNGASVDVRFIGGGSIAVNGRNVEVSGGSRLDAGIFPGFGMSEAQAGDIVINATDQVTITGTANFASVIANTVGSEATGNAGNIKLNTNNLILSNAQIDSSTSGQGNAGNISLQVGDAIALTDSSIITTNVQNGGLGKGGDVNIRGRSLTLTNGSQIQAGLFRQVDDIPGGIGTGGSIKVNTSDFVDISGFSFSNGLSGIFTPAETGSTGPGGSIDITTGAFRLANFAIVTAETANGNNGGDITINAKTFEATNGLVQTIVSGQAQAGRLFSAGDIQLNVTDSVSFKDGSRLNSDSSGEGNAGNVTIFAGGAVSLENGSSIFSDIESTGKGNGGQVSIQAGSLSLKDGSVVQVGTFGQGNAGSTIIKVQNTFSADGVGTDGLSSGIFSSVTENGIGNAGGIDITTGTLSLTNGGQIGASTFGMGDAGIVKIQANDISFDGVSSDGSSSGIFSNVQGNAVGNGGGIDISTGTLSLTNGAIINASTFNRGNAGTVKIQASGTIKASGVGSNDVISGIRSNVQDNATGNAGGIDISTKNLFFTNGAEITAITSGRGNAGNVKIQASDISFDGVGSTGFSSGIFSTVQGNAVGNGNGIDITTETLSLTNGAVINASTFATGDAGTVKIQASDTIKASGVGSNTVTSGIRNSVQQNAIGNAGGIDISTKNLFFTNGAQIIANTLSNGNAGSVKIQASDISFDGVSSNGFTSGIFSNVEGDAVGNGNGIDITTKTLSLRNGASLSASTFNRGNAGIVKIQASDISLNGVGSNGRSSGIFSSVAENGRGNADGIDIITKTLSLRDGAQISAGIFGQGNAGNVKIQASDFVDISGFNPVSQLRSGIFTSAETGSTGPGGSIDITTGAFRLTNFGVVTAGTANGNNGGDITINAKTFEATNGQVQTILSGQAEAGRLFIAGDIQLNVSDSVTLKNGSLINSSTSGIGNAGNISLQVGDAIALANSSQIRSVIEQGGEGIGGDIDIRARSLTLTGGSQIQTALIAEGNGLSGGKGRAGNIDINATDFVNIFGVGTAGLSSGLFASAGTGTTATSPQAAGNINLTSRNFRIADGAVVNALTSNSGDAGNITINANTFTANGGGQVITTTFNSGSAGNINLNIGDRITISGSDPNYNQRIEGTFDNQGAASGIFANTAPGSTGNGGNITIQQEQNSFPRIAIADGGEVTVDSQGRGQGGNVSITGNSLTLDRGIINASTQSSDGGNINLRLRNFLRLQNESLISANAGGQQGGNGGNITIDTPFIVAFLRNNDIIANAVGGDGGRVRTNATLFGIVPRTRADLERLGVPGLNPRNLPTSDITAFSEQNSSFGDNVLVTSPDVDPSRGLVELPETVSDPTQKIAQNPCQQGIGNEFFVTGRGGLPTTPNQTLNSDNVRVDLLQPVAISGNSRSATIKSATTVTATRVPAQGWIFNDKGQVVLTAYDPSNTGSQRPFSTAAACPAR
jgi:filamentous hemagglutinin family protein